MTRLGSLAVVVVFAIAGCSSNNANGSDSLVRWEAVKELNDQLPDEVRVFSGRNDDLPLRAWYVRIDQDHPPIRTQVVVSDDAMDNRETVSSFAADLGACVVVNAGYFRMDLTPSAHVGLLISRGRLVSPATPSVLRDSLSYETARAAIGFTNVGEADIAWVTTRNGTPYRWSAPPQHSPGRPAAPLDYSSAEVWNVTYGVAGGPALLVGGEMRVTVDQEVFFGTSIPDIHPRTAAGRTRDGRLILMVVDGRQLESRGASLTELASMMHDVGAVDALNLDGGGSSTLVVNGTLVNRPTGGVSEREVMSALATFCQ